MTLSHFITFQVINNNMIMHEVIKLSKLNLALFFYRLNFYAYKFKVR